MLVAASPASPGTPVSIDTPPPRLLDHLRAEIRVRHYSIRIETTYFDWARRFIVFHDKQHSKDLRAEEVTQFPTHLATERNVSSATQNQAKAALLFLYGQACSKDCGCA